MRYPRHQRLRKCLTRTAGINAIPMKSYNWGYNIRSARSAFETGFQCVAAGLRRLSLALILSAIVGVPDYFLNLSAGRHPDGFNDLSLGLKQQLGPVPGNIQLSIIAATSLPSGTGGISTHGIDPFLKVPWSKELQLGWSVGGMQSIFWTTENGRRDPTAETTVYVEKEVTEPWAVFLEYAGDFASLDGARQLLHIGTTYRIGHRTQVDAHVGFGISAAAPNHFVAVGYSFRLDSAR
jgi:hypothetical protein